MTQRIYHYQPYGELWECLDSQFYDFLLECGILGFGVSFHHKDLQKVFENIDVLVLSGGNDIGEYPQRDSLEFALLDFAIRHHKKVLGICRGMQVISQYFGLALAKSSHEIRAPHTLQGGLTHRVKSYHQFCVHSVPSGFEVLAYVGDEIEAMRNEQILGLMWHPEREEKQVRAYDVALVREFIHDQSRGK